MTPRISHRSHRLTLASATSRISHPSRTFFAFVIEAVSIVSPRNPSALRYRQELHQAGIYSDAEKTPEIFNIDCVYESLRHTPYYGEKEIICRGVRIFLWKNFAIPNYSRSTRNCVCDIS